MGHIALDSDVFRQFITVVASVLGTGGAVLVAAKTLLKVELTSVLKTYRSWLVMAPLPFAAIIGGREVTIALATTLSIFAFREFASATRLCADRWMTRLVTVAIVFQGIVTLMTDPRLLTHGWFGMFMTLPVFVITLIAVLPVVRNCAEGQLRSVTLAVFGYLYFGWMLGHLAFLANSPYAIGYLLYLLFAVAVADVAAFTSGKLFGKRKLRDQVSPNKTLGGALGSLAVSLALPWLMSFALPGFSPIQKLLAGLIIGIGGQLGDLTISYIKRDLGIKDMGQFIPGHGGLLDRIDSLIFTAPLFFHMIRWYAL